jgi:quercetin dioxygenase-like cupin family protein
MAPARNALESKGFASPEETREFAQDMGQLELVTLGGKQAGRGTFKPGWRWSDHVKPLAGTDSCQAAHLGYVVSGRMGIRTDAGEEGEIGAGEVFSLTPGHDAWTVGDEPCVLIDFTGMTSYALPA